MKYYSIHYNMPEFLSIQKECLKNKELIIINNHCNKLIREECNRLELKVYDLPNQNTDPSHSHGYALNFLKNIIDYTDDYCILDHDLFIIKELDFKDNEIISHKSTGPTGINHLWAGFMAFKKEVDIKDIDFLPVAGLGDTAVMTSKLLNTHKIHFMKETYIGSLNTNYVQTSAMISRFDDLAFHYLNGSDWMNTVEINKKNKKEILLQNLRLSGIII